MPKSWMRRAMAAISRLPAGSCTMAEVGVWTGNMSEQLLRRHEGLTLWMVDIWAEIPEGHAYRLSGSQLAQSTQEQMEAAMEEAEARTRFARDRRRICHMPSICAAAQMEPRSLDLVFIDAAHDYDSVTTDLEAWLPSVRRGGWIGGHDYGHPIQGEVREAVADFRRAFRIAPRLELDNNTTWFWRVR